jgi:hypothetical protein
MKTCDGRDELLGALDDANTFQILLGKDGRKEMNPLVLTKRRFVRMSQW